MKNRILWASALALAFTVTSQVESRGVTNGVILISTRAGQDTAAGTSYYIDEKGPGMVTPGDVEMLNLLSDHGYTCRLVLDGLLNGLAVGVICTLPPPPETWYQPIDINHAVMLLIVSGSGGSGDAPPPTQTNGIPMMVGEHVVLGNRADRPGSIFMYNNGSESSDLTQAQTTNKYMKVVAPNHPIMQGIPLDAQGRVKIWRDKFPEEAKYLPIGGRDNYTFRWCLQRVTNAAPGTTILGVLDEDPNRACFAVNDIGGRLANNTVLGFAETNQIRLVHMFVNEEGSNSARRDFNSLTDIGRVIWLRAAKWAMGEALQPYQTFRITEAKPAGAQAINVSWESSARYNYKIQASTDFSNWQTVIEDLIGADGVLSRTLNIGEAPQTLYLRVARMP